MIIPFSNDLIIFWAMISFLQVFLHQESPILNGFLLITNLICNDLQHDMKNILGVGTK